MIYFSIYHIIRHIYTKQELLDSKWIRKRILGSKDMKRHIDFPIELQLRRKSKKSLVECRLVFIN